MTCNPTEDYTISASTRFGDYIVENPFLVDFKDSNPLTNRFFEQLVDCKKQWREVDSLALEARQEKNFVSKMSKLFSTCNSGQEGRVIKSKVEVALKEISTVERALEVITDIVNDMLTIKNKAKGFFLEEGEKTYAKVVGSGRT